MTAVATSNDEHIARMLQDQERNENWQRHQVAHSRIQKPGAPGQQQPHGLHQSPPPPPSQRREPSPPQPANPIDQGLQRAPPSNPIAAELRPDDLPPGAPATTALDLDGDQAVQSPNELPEYQGAPQDQQQRPAVVPPSSHAAGAGAGGASAMSDEQLAIALQDEEIRTSRQQYREQQRREIAHERPAENKVCRGERQESERQHKIKAGK